MNLYPKRLSLKIKLAVLISVLIAFVTTGILLYFVAQKIVKNGIISDLRVQSKVIGLNCAAAILFEDRKAAKDILSSLRLMGEIESAVLYDKDGREFAYYIKEGSIYRPHYFEMLDADDYIVVVGDIKIDEEVIGKIALTSNLSRLRSQSNVILLSIAMGISFSLLISFILVSFFVNKIFSPLENLIATMRKVSEEKNYGVRAEVLSEDEFGDVVRGFNDMLMQIQQRDEELNKYREHLEEEVRKRTQELETLNIRLGKELEEVKRMEEMISKSAAEWRTTFDSINDAVFLLDESGNVIRCNKMASIVTGLSYSEIIGKPICGVAHNDIKGDCGVLEVMRDKIRVSREIHLRDKFYQISYDPILSEGKLIGVVHIMSDITEKHNLDENIRQIQKMEAIGRLAGGVAHDFNNLLSIMTLYTGSLIKRLKDDPRAQNELNEIKKVIERATTLSKQLLAFSRKQILNPEVFDVNESLRLNHKMLSRLIGENIKIELILSDGQALIYADKSQFENVIMNMVINSKDAMPNGGVIKISTELRKPEKDEIVGMDVKDKEFVILKISDNGIGMTEDVQKKIFEPFFTTKPKGKGTGLGLAMVYSFVRQCNGYIDVKSKLGDGTMFTIYFPISLPSYNVQHSRSGLIKVVSDLKMRILVVEDDNDVRRSIVKMLEENNFEVRDTPRALEALEMIIQRKERYGLIVSDIIMPEMNGIEFFKKVKEFDSSIPFILITGYSDDYLPQEDMSEFKDIILQKPFSEYQLLEKIRDVVSIRR